MPEKVLKRIIDKICFATNKKNTFDMNFDAFKVVQNRHFLQTIMCSVKGLKVTD